MFSWLGELLRPMTKEEWDTECKEWIKRSKEDED